MVSNVTNISPIPVGYKPADDVAKDKMREDTTFFRCKA